MNVICVFKWEHKPDDAMIGADGSVTWRSPKLSPSDDDAAALIAARDLAVESGADLVAVTAGQGDASWALARGAQRAVSLPDFVPDLDEAATARALADVVRQAGGADVVVMGNAADRAGVAGALAAALGAPVLAGADQVSVDPTDPARVRVRRKSGNEVETLSAAAPVVVAVAAASQEKSAPGVKELLAARKRPVEKVEPTARAEEAGSVALTASRRPAAKDTTMLEGDAAQVSHRLVAALRSDGVL